MSIRICVNGVSGWTGSAVARAVIPSDDFELVGAVARKCAGQDAGSVLGLEPIGLAVVGSVEEGLAAGPDVMIDYTHPSSVKRHLEVAIDAGVHSIVGTSGLSGDEYQALAARAKDAGVGIIAAGNFSLTAALAKHFAGIAAKYVPHWEIIDYSYGGKPDAPSGTVRELAEFLGGIRENQIAIPIEDTAGTPETRGATLGGAQVHAVRLPGYVLSFEALFGLPNERLSIRHDSGAGADPYVSGTLLAAKRVMETTGLVRGLDTLLFGPDA